MGAKIRILGTGNAFLPHGRTHSLTIIDDCHLIDAPPTALLSLRKNGISPKEIRTIFITHLHGDHIFGFPFLLLERKYISDRDGNEPLTVVVAPGGRDILEQLCRTAYPGSLESMLTSITWVEHDAGTLGTSLSWSRFRVHHVDAVDPFGYRFDAEDFSFVHSGDSGPCAELYKQIENVDIAIIEMGVPDYVQSDEHHSPQSILALAQQCSTPLVVTHTYIDDDSHFPPLVTKQLPDHPSHVLHASDGLTITWDSIHSIPQFE